MVPGWNCLHQSNLTSVEMRMMTTTTNGILLRMVVIDEAEMCTYLM